MKGQKLKNVIHDYAKMKRSLSNTAPFPGNWLHSKQTGFNQFVAHRMDKRAADESISDPKNTTDQKVFSFHLKKDECVEVKTKITWTSFKGCTRFFQITNMLYKSKPG